MFTGLNKIDGQLYHFNDGGIMSTGWKQTDGKWFYYAPSGEQKKAGLNITMHGTI